MLDGWTNYAFANAMPHMKRSTWERWTWSISSQGYSTRSLCMPPSFPTFPSLPLTLRSRGNSGNCLNTSDNGRMGSRTRIMPIIDDQTVCFQSIIVLTLLGINCFSGPKLHDEFWQAKYTMNYCNQIEKCQRRWKIASARMASVWVVVERTEKALK